LTSRLKQLRQAHDLTQEAFAELAGISYKYYQQVETGRKPDLRLSTLERLAHAYGVEVYELLAPAVPKTRVKVRRSASSRRGA
jgi:transcriptional regulator with XRE-family HTH domain